MKKISVLFLSLFLLFCCTGCQNTASSAVPQNKREVIELTKDNYQKYIAVYARASIANTGGSYDIITLYYYDFVGSNLCKFKDAKIKYSFDNTSEIYTCDLNLSGCGQSNARTAKSRYTFTYDINITEVTGTVEILY